MRALGLFASILFLTFAAVAQNVPAVQAQNNTIFSGADGTFEASPDTAVLRLDLASQQDTSKAAYDHVSASADRVRQALNQNGIETRAMQIGFYSVQAMYDWKNPKHKVVGYRVSTTLTLKLRDFSKVSAMIEQTADLEDTQSQSLNYILEDMEPAKAKAAEDAFKKARNQANTVASAGGRGLGELLYASVDINQPVIMPMVMKAQTAMAGIQAPSPTAGFTPQNITINAHVNALFALK